jgi:hypothetical protein
VPYLIVDLTAIKVKEVLGKLSIELSKAKEVNSGTIM